MCIGPVELPQPASPALLLNLATPPTMVAQIYFMFRSYEIHELSYPNLLFSQVGMNLLIRQLAYSLVRN